MKNADKSINPITNSQNDDLLNVGLTKREYFAVMAMQGLLVNFSHHGHYGNSDHLPMVAEIAVQQADELLKQLDQ